MPAPRHGIVATAKQRAIRLSCQGSLDLKLRVFQMLVVRFIIVFLIVGIGNLCQSHKELVVFGDVFCHRAGCQEK